MKVVRFGQLFLSLKNIKSLIIRYKRKSFGNFDKFLFSETLIIMYRVFRILCACVRFSPLFVCVQGVEMKIAATPCIVGGDYFVCRL